MSEKTGGPAFPDFIKDGMTLRDYFAAKAMQGFLELDMQDEYFASEIAKEAYRQADAMLKARNN